MRNSVKEQGALGFSMRVYLQGKTMRAFSNIQVCHIFWEETCVAPKLAHTAGFSSMDEFWLEERDTFYYGRCHLQGFL